MTTKPSGNPKPGISDQFRLIIDAILDYGIFMLDTEGHILTWNAGAERTEGYTESEILGTHFSVFYPDADIRLGKPGWELEIARQNRRFEEEGWRIRKDGSKFWANVVITAIHDDDGVLIGYGSVTRDFTERKEQQERLTHSEERFRNARTALGSARKQSIPLSGLHTYAFVCINMHNRSSRRCFNETCLMPDWMSALGLLW